MARAVRGKGEGSVYQRSDGRWVAQVEAGRTTSGRRRYTRATRPTEAEALTALRDLQRQTDVGVVPDQTRTLATYLDWWADNVLRGTVRISTEADYRSIIGRWIVPHIGTVRLGKLTPAHVVTMLRRLEDDGLSPRSRQYTRAVLRRALGWAEQTGFVARNAAALAPGPRTAGPKLDDALSATEAALVLDTAAGDRLEALAVLVLRLGLRRGEALALSWSDVDFAAGTLTVDGTLKAKPGGGTYIDRPKTAAGARTLPLVAPVAKALRDHKRRQAAEQLAAGDLWIGSGHVFTNERGEPIGPRNASAWWNRLTERAGVGHRRFHASRHTAATLLLDQGVPLEVVSAILGHANVGVTADVYARVTQDSKRRALAKLDEVLG